MPSSADTNGAGTRLSANGAWRQLCDGHRAGTNGGRSASTTRQRERHQLRPWLRTAAGNTPGPDDRRDAPRPHGLLRYDSDHKPRPRGSADAQPHAPLRRRRRMDHQAAPRRLRPRPARQHTVRFRGCQRRSPDKSAVIASTKPTTVLTRLPAQGAADADPARTERLQRSPPVARAHTRDPDRADIAVERKQVDAACSAAQAAWCPPRPPHRSARRTTAPAWTKACALPPRQRLQPKGRWVSMCRPCTGPAAARLRETRSALRFDHLAGEYFSNAIPNNAQTPVTRTSYRDGQPVELARRRAVAAQPAAELPRLGTTSFNTRATPTRSMPPTRTSRPRGHESGAWRQA